MGVCCRRPTVRKQGRHTQPHPSDKGRQTWADMGVSGQNEVVSVSGCDVWTMLEGPVWTSGLTILDGTSPHRGMLMSKCQTSVTRPA